MKRLPFEHVRCATRARVRGGATLLGLCALGGVCALVVSACGSSSAAAGTTSAGTTATSTTGTSTTGTPTASPAASFAAYQTCLTSHGGTAFARGSGFVGGTRPSGASGFKRPKPTAAEAKAQAACASLRPTGGFAGGGFGGRGGISGTAFAKYTACLKSHGVTLGPGVSRTSSAYTAAQTACAKDRPAGFGGGSGGFGAAPGSSGGASNSAFAKTQACLRSHGVNPADPSASTPAKMSAAIAACRSAGTSTTTTTTTT